MKTRTSKYLEAGTAVHATLIGASDTDASGKWIMLLPAGSFSGRNGLGPYDNGDAAHMQGVVAQTMARAGNTDLVIDYDHQSVFSAVPGVGGVAPAAGWIKKFEVRADGLYGLVEWTEKAASAIKANEYRYISPVYHHDKSGRVLRLISAGLTNTPNLDLAGVAASASFNNSQEEDMDKIALALGLAAQGASEADILAAINAAMTSVSAIAVSAGLDKSAKPADVVTAVASMRADVDKMAVASGLVAGAKTTDVVTAVQSAVAGSADPTKFVPIAQVVALQNDINSLRASRDDEAATVAVNKAIEDGKLLPALKDWGLALHKADKAQFDTFVGAAPVLTAVQRAGAQPPGNGGDPALSEGDLAVMSQMGLIKEAFIAAKKGAEH